jgi:hypothetical protein
MVRSAISEKLTGFIVAFAITAIDALANGEARSFGIVTAKS